MIQHKFSPTENPFSVGSKSLNFLYASKELVKFWVFNVMACYCY